MTQHDIPLAKKTIAGFVSLIVGQNTKVIWSDKACMRPDGTVMLPQPRVGDAAEIALLTRMAVHESGHKMHTDVGCFDRLPEEAFKFFNLLEDPRIERELTNQYPGAELVLSRGLAGLVEHALSKSGCGTPDEKSRLLQLGVVLKGLQAAAPKRVLDPYMPELDAKLRQAFSQEQVESIDTAVSKIAGLKNSLECEALALELMASFAKASTPDENDGQSDESDAQETGQDDQTPSADASDESSDGNGDHESGPEEQSTSADSPSEPSGSDDGEASSAQSDSGAASSACAGQPGADTAEASEQSSDGPQESVSPSDGSSEPGDPSALGDGMDLGEMLAEMHEQLYPQSDQTDAEADQATSLTEAEMARFQELAKEAYLDFETLLAKAQAMTQTANEESEAPPSTATEAAGGGLASQTVTMGNDIRLTQVQSRLVHILLRELQDKRKKPSKNARAGAQVNAQRFWRLQRLGDTNVFRVRSHVTGIDCGVTLLLDRSGSMSPILDTAAQVTLAFSMALQRIGNVKTSVAVFPWLDAFTHTLQAFGESPRLVASRCESLGASGGTPVGQAILSELPKLLAQGKQKNLMIVVTDGRPDSPHLLSAALDEARQCGVDVYAIGIGFDVRGHFPASTSVDDVDGLPHAIEQLFKQHVAQQLAA